MTEAGTLTALNAAFEDASSGTGDWRVAPLQPVPEPEPPACPGGWHTGPPDFVGVGAQRSGTTWWHRLICAHPEVCFERGVHRKEVHFFDTLAGHERLSEEEIERYGRHFPRPAGAALAGEWTPDYMDYPWVAGQLVQAAPKARVLVLLRDPVDRYASGFARASRLAAEQGIEGLERKLVERHIERGMYFEQINRLLEVYPRGRVLVLQYEACRGQREEQLERTYGFLGIEPGLGPPPEQLGAREPRERSLPAAERDRLAALFAPDVRKLAALVPDLDLSLWPSVAGLV
jgi:Sulfotransferase domain